MSSSKQKEKEVDVNIGRGGLGVHSSSKGQPGVIGQPGIVGAQQGNVLLSNDPATVVSQEQRLASNRPIVTEKFISREYIPVTHEEIVTTVPIVTGQAVHTGQAFGGEKTVQPMGVEYLKQQAATKVDLMPQVQTQLGPQEVVNIPVNQVPQPFGHTTVIPSQQATTRTTTAVTEGLAQTQFGGTGTCGTQPLCAQTFGTQNLGAQPFGTQLGAQNLTTQTTTLGTGTQPLSTPLNTGQAGLGSGAQGNIGQKKNY